MVDAYVLKGMSELLDGKLMVYALVLLSLFCWWSTDGLVDLHSLLEVECHCTCSDPFFF